MHRSLFPLFIILILGICYALTIAPDLTWAHYSADGGDLITAAATGGVPHPGGYPLYLILARLFQLLPVGSLAFRTNLLSACFTIWTSLLLYQHTHSHFSDAAAARFASFLAALAYGLAPFVWGQALVTEVYALHGFLLLLCIHVLSLKETEISEWLRGLVLGIAAANHLTSLLIFPLLFLNPNAKSLVSPQVLMKRVAGMLGGLSLYLILPMRSYFDPPINWENASTWTGFFALVSGEMYHSYSFAVSVTDVFQRLRAFAGLLLEQYTWVGVLAGIYGLILPPPRQVLISTGWMACAFLFFAVGYGSYDSHVNLLPIWLVFAIWLAFGLRSLLQWLPVPPKPRLLSACVLFVALLIRIPVLWPSVDASNDMRAMDFIEDAVQKIPQDSLVVLEGDAQIFSLWYARYVLEQRQDLVLIAEGLLPYAWYRESLQKTYPDVVLPDGGNIRASDVIDANRDQPWCDIEYDHPIICVKR